MYMPTRSRWTTMEPKMLPIKDSNRHMEVTTIGVYISLHMV